MDIKETFLKLTRHTYPHGYEHWLFDILPQDLEMDDFGNLFTKIGDNDVMFTSHLDTATSANTEVNHVFEGNIIKTDGKSILGADDKAGVTIMLYMIENKIPGLYYFFLGEEVGCVGSRKVSEKHKSEKLPYINKVISFDRRGTGSIITYQASSRCCSDEFALALSKDLNTADTTFKYDKDPTGVYTDSAQFVKIYPECTNISVGYYSEHTFSERQDIDHLTKLANAVLKVDWSSLPVKRDPSVVDYTSYYDSWSYYDDNRYGMDGYMPKSGCSNWNSTKTEPKDEKSFFHDRKYNYISSFTKNEKGEYVSVDLHSLRIDDEREDIFAFLSQIDVDYKTVSWDGVTLIVTYRDGRKSDASRNDLIEYLPILDLVKESDKSVIDNCVEDIQKTYGYHDDYYGDM